ncbi:sorbosone dehydrogenase family protein [Haloprofundus sp. MHR1]|uniref:PQQ-dependent sugar dehydrogenase n=1 Tax=Haloprofundus sp. MHR1 TaxID=2572921 RepID=UPI0010BF4FFC|nr:PQQ-dependent sugar dehydrogenase [Haloprofundus sp. MHR1]QCJ45780.1 PQQ-dependent sugar dehydrogenase [Haloprofundus sp. MHR1]
MNRRTYLGLAGVVALGGCLDDPTTSDPPGNDSAEPSTDDAETTSPPPQTIQHETVVTGLEIPWGAAWRDGDLYLTERLGRIVRIPDGEGDPEELLTVDDVVQDGEGGLLGLVFHPNEPAAYTYHTYSGGEYEFTNRIVRHDLENGWEWEPIVDGIPGDIIHDGGRLAVYEDSLLATVGDANDRDRAQDTDSLNGKVLRLTFDGEPHPDNPFDNEVFTYGHRNPQGLAFRQGTIFSTEHGPAENDEVNVLEAGNNYGWPEVGGTESTDEYTGAITEYTPTIAPASATFYDGPYREWQGDFFFGTLAGEHLRRLRIDGTEVVEDEPLYEGEFGRLRTVFTGPDGHLYAVTSNRDGRGEPRDGDDRVVRFFPEAE